MIEWNKDISWLIDINYDSTYCTGGCDVYCRCSQIINIKIDNVDCYEIVSELLGKDATSYKICVLSRALIFNRVWDNIDVQVAKGYYGDQIIGDSIDFPCNIIEKIENLMRLDDLTEQTYFLLQMEYGYIPNQYKNLSFSLGKIPVGAVEITNMRHFQQSKNSVEFDYKKYPTCVVKQIADDKYQLIDGYHRLASLSNKTRKIIAVVGVE